MSWFIRDIFYLLYNKLHYYYGLMLRRSVRGSVRLSAYCKFALMVTVFLQAIVITVNLETRNSKQKTIHYVKVF